MLERRVFYISTVKKGIIHFRVGMRFIVWASIAAILIVGAIFTFYKPTYAVSYNGEFLGYIDNKSQLQTKINEYIKTGTGNENIAFVQIESVPEYDMCLLKKDVETNDNEIYNKIIESGVSYYKYYIILLNGEEKYYLQTREQADSVISKLKEKDSNNIEKITISEKFNTELVQFADVDTCVSELYEKKVVIPPKRTYVAAAQGKMYFNGNNTSGNKIDLGISLIHPVSGTISSRFGWRGSSFHTGLDIAAPGGTPIQVAASGTITYAGYHYSYGNLLIVTHDNGVQTYYAHCSRLYVSYGQYVTQGQTIAAVGSTGNSTGNHLHLEIRVNGQAQNPQNYLY